MMENILNSKQIEYLKISGRILSESMKKVISGVDVGVTSFELDCIAESSILQQGGVPSFKNYHVRGVGKYPFSLCVSINDEVVHGLPNKDRIISDGDLVSLDLGVSYRGICSDMAYTLAVGKVSPEIIKMIEITKECLSAGIKAAAVGRRIGAIGHAIETIAKSEGFGIVRDLVGHGIGTRPHMDPPIPNFGNNQDGPEILEGMALAIEPMLTLGSHEVRTGDDGWTIKTKDLLPSAHFEHTIVIIEGKPHILTEIK